MFYFLFFLLRKCVIFHRLLVGDCRMKLVYLNYSVCGNWETLNVGLNWLIGFTRLQKLLGIFQIFIWNSPIKLELNCGLLQLVSQDGMNKSHSYYTVILPTWYKRCVPKAAQPSFTGTVIFPCVSFEII